MTLKRSRSRSDVTATRLAEILRPYSVRKRWLSYAEDLKAPCQALALKAHAPLLRTLREELGDSMAILPTTAEQAFEVLEQEKRKEWNLSESQQIDYKKRMGKRLRAMLRHTSQGLIKETKWILALMNGDVHNVEDEDEWRAGNDEETCAYLADEGDDAVDDDLDGEALENEEETAREDGQDEHQDEEEEEEHAQEEADEEQEAG